MGDDRRFTLSAVSEVIGCSAAMVRAAAHTLGIKTGRHGYSVDQIREIRDYMKKRRRDSADELRAILKGE